jgi:large subunit ribosomal protein L9e
VQGDTIYPYQIACSVLCGERLATAGISSIFESRVSRNFLGEQRLRSIDMMEGVKLARSTDAKDQIELEGNDLDALSRSAALIHQATLVKRKDIRKFLDGIYINWKGNVVEEE